MRFRKFIILLFSVWLLISTSVGLISIAAQEENQPKTTYFSSALATIDVGILRTTVTGTVSGVDSVTSIKIKLELQKKSGASYSTIKTWEETFSGHNAMKIESKTTSPLSTYRLKATFTVYTSTSSETRVVYEYDN